MVDFSRDNASFEPTSEFEMANRTWQIEPPRTHPSNAIDPRFEEASPSNRFAQYDDVIARQILAIPHHGGPSRQQVYEEDYLWESSSVGRWETLAKTLPAMVTRGSIIVERGKPHFKGSPLVECPRCQTKLSRGTATLTFRHAPSATREQQVEAWICSCGEFYVPGEIAREAYLRAFAKAPELPKGEREYQAFLRLLPELLTTHPGKYVAIHNGQVVDSDTNDVALILRVQAKIGYVPIHVDLVTAAQPVVRIPHYHEVRPQRIP